MLDTEFTVDWVNDQWSAPIDFASPMLGKFGTQPVSIQAGVRYWADNPDTGAHDFGARLNIIFRFPTRNMLDCRGFEPACRHTQPFAAACTEI
jgi:hypothetical protein